MPLVNKVTKTLLNVTNLLRCVRYRHRVRVVYPGLGETEQKVYADHHTLHGCTQLGGQHKNYMGNPNMNLIIQCGLRAP